MKFVVAAVIVVSLAILLIVGPGREATDEPAPTQPVQPHADDEQTDADPSGAPTTSSTVEPGSTGVASGNEDLYDRARRLAAAPTVDGAIVVAEDMAATGDPGWVPYLVDLTRTLGVGDALGVFASALEALTGLPVPGDTSDVYVEYGSWMYRTEPNPGPRYIEWKADLYGLIDPSFRTLILQTDDPVLASRLQWGGVRRGGIPELNNPGTLSVADAAYMTEEELTFGAVVNGEARSYPHRILDHHELANDTLGGEPVALANCTLCRTGIMYSRRVGDTVLVFETSGLLLNSNKVMVDVETDSLWNQLTGAAIAGPLAGTVLERFSMSVTTYGDWVAEHPGTSVVAIPETNIYSYEPGDAYATYYATDEVWFPIAASGSAFDEKEEVATLDTGDARLAVGLADLEAAGPSLIVVGDSTVVAVPTNGGARFYEAPTGGVELDGSAAGEISLELGDGRSLPRLQSGHSFWFAWYANHPDTVVWPAG